jgi:AbrB family looped-hinge helix DNA binding protein
MGRVVIPKNIREQAQLKPGDPLDVGYVNGLVVMRKLSPRTPAKASALILSGGNLPVQRPEDEAEVGDAIAAVRRRRRPT